MHLFGMRMRRAGRPEERSFERSSSEESESESDFEEDLAPRRKGSMFSWKFSQGQRGRKSSASRGKAKSRQMGKVVRRVRDYLPKDSQGWGVLILSVLLVIYLADFYSLLPASDNAQAPTTRVWQQTQNRVASAPITAQKEPAKPAAAAPVNDQHKLSAEHDGASQNVYDGKVPIDPASESRAQPAAGKNAAADQTIQSLVNNIAADLNRPPANAGASAFSREDVGLWVPAQTGKLSLEEVKKYYVRLAKKYLEPFSAGISRDHFFQILKRKTYSVTPDGANKGIQSMLFQLTGGRVYLLDPFGVRQNAKPFYRSRINEIIYLLSDLLRQNRVPETEFLVSIHDCVQTVSKPHTYRAARYAESSPGFTIVGCNFSDNIPFPMWEGDDSRGGGYVSWNERMKEYAEDDISWSTKMPKAVFRGGIRASTVFSNKTDAEQHCETAGRSALAHKGQLRPDILDVSVSGACAGKKYTLSRLEPREHHRYKYVLYAEGNCFWADRINRQLFGPSLIVKQETPCGQFFEPLLQPGVHYVPTDFYFNGLEERIESLKMEDDQAQQIVRNANEFAWNFLSAEGIAAFVEVMLREYTDLLETKKIVLDKNSQDVTNEPQR